MPKLQIRRRDEIFRDIINAVVARTDLSDVTDTSTVKHTAGAVARQIAEVYFQFTRLAALFDFNEASGVDLDERSKEIFGGTRPRLGARRAVGKLTFSRSTATPAAVSVATGSAGKDSEENIVESVEVTTILASATSAVAAARARDPGAAGNVESGALVWVGKPVGVDTIEVSQAFTGGRDRETDDEFRARLLALVGSLSRCTPQALEFGVLDAIDPDGSGRSIQYAHVYEDSAAPGTAEVFIDDGAGTVETSEEVEGVESSSGTLTGPDIDGDMTFTASSGTPFTAAMVGSYVSFVAATTAANNGAFLVKSSPTTASVTFANASGVAEAFPGAFAVGELVTLGLAGPSINSAVGGEEYLDLANIAIVPGTETLIIHRGNANGILLTRGVDYLIRNTNGRIRFTPALLSSDRVIADYFRYTGLIRHAQRIVDGDTADRVNFPGWRAAGVDVQVAVPTVRAQAVTCILVVAAGYTRSVVITSVEQAINRYINSLGISGDVVTNEIIERIMGVPGVTDVRLISPVCTTASTVMLDHELARIDANDIDVT